MKTKDEVEKEISERFYNAYLEYELRYENGDSSGIAEWSQKVYLIRDEWFQFLKKTNVLVTPLMIETQENITLFHHS